MPEEIARGRSLDEIRQEWAQKWGCSPEQLQLEVLEKPGFLSRQWKVRVYLLEPDVPAGLSEPTEEVLVNIEWDGERYIIDPGPEVEEIFPPRRGGEMRVNGEPFDQAVTLKPGDVIEFIPWLEPGELKWELEVRFQGAAVFAKVQQKSAGRYALMAKIPRAQQLDLDRYLVWEDLPPSGEIWDKDKLNSDLQELKVTHGRRNQAWDEILAVRGSGEVVVAEAILPIPPSPPQLEDFVGAPQPKDTGESERIDFFASKVQLVQEGSVLARKKPGIPGTPGTDVFGRQLPAQAFRDFNFRLKKNVRLSEDGLEVIATCAGLPVRLDELTYMVDNVYVLNRDVDLSTGSIEFTGDVMIGGNVLDGLHIFATGKVEIQGAVSHAEIRAEKGLKIHRNVLGGKLVVGEKYVVRAEILRQLKGIHDELNLCLLQTEELLKSPAAASLKPGQYLKKVLERNFPELPKRAAKAESYVLARKDELITSDLLLAVKSAKRFLSGLGPLEPQALPLLNKINKAFAQFVENISLEVPEKLACVVDYIQGTTVETGGSFQCVKGAYNSEIRADGDVTIEGVCRGGKILAGGNVSIRELGGSGVSTTLVQIIGSKRLKVNYCHPNAIIAVDKEIIRIEEAYKNLEVYRERGLVQVEKLRANPL